MFKSRIIIFVLSFFALLFSTSCVRCDSSRFDAGKAEVFYTENIAKNWQSAIPADAKKFYGSISKGIEVEYLCKEVVDEVVLYVEFDSPCEGKVYSAGIGCSGSFIAYCNGMEIAKEGKNRHYRFEAWNHPVQITAKKGKNLLAFKLKKEKRDLVFRLDGMIEECFNAPHFDPVKRTSPAPETARKGASYRVIVLGDTHYESYEYHPTWKRDPNKIPGFIEMWQERLPRLLDSAAAKQNDKTRLVVQVGDLVQGGCDDTATHIKVVNDGFAEIKKRFKNVPVVFTPGNHDYQGKIATMSFNDAYFPLMSRELGRKIDSRNFYFTIDQDLYISLDFDGPDLDMLKKALEENSDCRYKFVLTHGSVLPSDKNGFKWYMLYDEPLYSYTRNLLMKHNAIIISGHSHTNEMVDCDAENGRLTQITASSAWTPAAIVENKALFTKAEDYGKRQKNPANAVRFNEIKDALKEYWFAENAGYFVLDISPDGIVANYYSGDKKESIYSYKLR